MAPAGVEMLVGVVNDSRFGPTIACGAGGTLVELLKDVSVRLTPLTRRDAESMLRELRSFPLLEGYRGTPPCDLGALEDLLLGIAALAEDHPDIAELDCNPLIVSASGALVVDARVRVAVGVWFYAIVLAGAAFAALLIVRALRADSRFLAGEATHAEYDPGTPGRFGAGRAGTPVREASGESVPLPASAGASAPAS
jgi:ATP-grasp domain